MKKTAVVITFGRLHTLDGKTAHGLLRGSERFQILAVLDGIHAGRAVDDIVPGASKEIPIYADIEVCLRHLPRKPDYCIMGVALPGGRFPNEFIGEIQGILEKGISVISGLHEHLIDQAVLRETAARYQVDLIDIRKPRPASELHFWSGAIMAVTTPRIAVLGMDCTVGKRTTCRFIQQACRSHGIKAEMIYTGHTGWLQGYRYGFFLDATPNDFVSGEIENAIVTCDRESRPDLILIEGQSSLMNPSGPCGSEILLSGNVKGVILQHVPFRGCFDELESLGMRLPAIEDEIALIRTYGAQTLGVTLNGSGGTLEELKNYRDELAGRLSLPVILPLQEGVQALLPVIRSHMKKGD